MKRDADKEILKGSKERPSDTHVSHKQQVYVGCLSSVECNIQNRTVALHHRCDVDEHAHDVWWGWLVQKVNYKRPANS